MKSPNLGEKTRARRGIALVAAALGLFSLSAGFGAACSASASPTGFAAGGGGLGGGDVGGAAAAGGALASSGLGGNDLLDASTDSPVEQQDPTTCAEAAASRTYVGCDFWPTVVDNMVRPIFDYAVAVANAGAAEADITVTQGGMMVATAKVQPNALATIYLPWVDALKSTVDQPFCVGTSVKTETVSAKGGAYHLTSTLPVTVYQFNAIEYAGKGGPPGKDWSGCTPQGCVTSCFSYTNDASLLLPSTALTGTYRIGGLPAWDSGQFVFPPYFAVTGTEDGTSVSVKLSSTANVKGGGGVASAPAGGTVTFTVDAGDVVEVISDNTNPNSDMSGTLVTATKPVQVISGMACTQNPHGTPACDHIEESVFPAETLGKHYIVTAPTSPLGTLVGHVVRIYGNVDGTVLTYVGQQVGGPTVINAGDVADLGVVKIDFEVQGSHEFAVGSFQLGADLLEPGISVDQQKGDPSMSFMTTVEQYRKKYIFLAPADYDVSFVDVVEPMGTTLKLDGNTVGIAAKPLSSGYGVARVELGPGVGGAHVLTASAPVGIQVSGYGTYTSYQYPGGSNLGKIAPPPLK